MRDLVAALLALSGWQAACLLSLLPLLEASTLVGILLPGETALVIGGVLAHRGRVALPWMLVAGSIAAVLGDSIGYVVGRRWGESLVHSRLAARRWQRARRYLHSRGFAAVAFGRFGPGVRSLIPLAAGAARMPYGRFFAANVLGGVAWAVSSVLLGWAAGAAWQRAHWIAIAAGLAVIAVMAGVAAHRRRAPRDAGAQLPVDR